jgi:hypothetical protein
MLDYSLTKYFWQPIYLVLDDDLDILWTYDRDVPVVRNLSTQLNLNFNPLLQQKL